LFQKESSIKKYHLGVYIKDALEVMKMTTKEFSVKTGISKYKLHGIISGNSSITFEIASKLSSFFNNSIKYWLSLQIQYDLYLKRI